MPLRYAQEVKFLTHIRIIRKVLTKCEEAMQRVPIEKWPLFGGWEFLDPSSATRGSCEPLAQAEPLLHATLPSVPSRPREGPREGARRRGRVDSFRSRVWAAAGRVVRDLECHVLQNVRCAPDGVVLAASVDVHPKG